jgi:hypothetical protein
MILFWTRIVFYLMISKRLRDYFTIIWTRHRYGTESVDIYFRVLLLFLLSIDRSQAIIPDNFEIAGRLCGWSMISVYCCRPVIGYRVLTRRVDRRPRTRVRFRRACCRLILMIGIYTFIYRSV